MSKSIATFCPYCDEDVTASLKKLHESLTIRNESIAYEAIVAVCPICSSIIADSRIESGNLERAYQAYCTKHNLMSPREIKNLRQSYGLSEREFIRFLGFGEQTIYRYETGSIPDTSHNATLCMAATGIAHSFKVPKFESE
jgi:putative zinc finger/helix-turn-helix YgiT family protein